MSTKIKLTGTPPSTSSIYKYRNCGNFVQGYMNSQGKDCKLAYQYEMKNQWRSVPNPNDVIVKLKFYFKDKRVRDLDNYNKLVLDAGTGIIWVDDCQIQELHLYKFIDKDNPRVEIEIL